MKKNWKKLLIAGAVIAVATVNVKTVLDDNRSEKLLKTSLATIAEDVGDNTSAIYVRHEGTCTIEGRGRIEVFGKGVIEVKGRLTIDGKVACSDGGEYICNTVDCKDLYMWTD